MDDPERKPPDSSARREGPRLKDWHPADVLAALKKRGLTLAGLSIANGYHPTAAGKALRRPWPALEAIVAAALELAPHDIWPSRYENRVPTAAADSPLSDSGPAAR